MGNRILPPAACLSLLFYDHSLCNNNNNNNNNNYSFYSNNSNNNTNTTTTTTTNTNTNNTNTNNNTTTNNNNNKTEVKREVVNSEEYYEEYFGHRLSHLRTIRQHFVNNNNNNNNNSNNNYNNNNTPPTTTSFIYLVGDSTLDNKHWIQNYNNKHNKTKWRKAENGYEDVLSPPPLSP